MPISALQKITRQGLGTVKSKAAPVALVTAVDCGSQRAGLATLDLGGLKSCPSTDCHHYMVAANVQMLSRGSPPAHGCDQC